MPTIIEQTFNDKLGEILRQKNPRWRLDSEPGGALKDANTRPDILINPPRAMLVVVETEFMPARTVEQDAIGRLGKIVRATEEKIEQVVALRIPLSIRNVAQRELENAIRTAEFEYCLLSCGENSQQHTRWPHSGWLCSDVDGLVAVLENALLSEKLVAESLDILEGGVSSATAHFLGMTEDKPDAHNNIAELLKQSKGTQTTRMAMAIIANALTFHGILAGAHRVENPSNFLMGGGKIDVSGILDSWVWIVEHVNYYPIFDIARNIARCIPATAQQAVFQTLLRVADNLIAIEITASHDLYGRMFQQLITDRKFLATFYTLPESAMLLAEIAVEKMRVNYASATYAHADTVTKKRIVDFACGTGTLLSAAYHALLARYRRAGNDDAEIHQTMMEEALFAADIMPAGVHLAVSVLSSVHPTITFDKTKVHTLPYGGEKVALGALDLMDKQSSYDLLGERTQLGGRGEREIGGQDIREKIDLEHDSFDLVIMNPPFTRPTNHEITDKLVPSFAGFATSGDEQKAMSQKLKQINVRLPDNAGNGYAGLASNFIDLAHLKLKAGGVLAMVLPSTFAQGGSWADSRALVDRNYDDIIVVSIASTGKNTTSFSADTSMSEVLLIAKKREKPRKTGRANCKFVSLKARPANAVQAAVVAQAIAQATDTIYAGDEHLGEITLSNLQNGGAVGVLDHDLIAATTQLTEGKLALPSADNIYSLPIATLGEIADRGLVHRFIRESKYAANPIAPFAIEKIRPNPTYPCLWSHNSDLERSFIVEPDTQGRVIKGMEESAQEVWKTRTTLHFNLDFRLTSNSLAACVTPMPTLGGRAWPNVSPYDPKHEPVIVLWANSTLGLLLRWNFGSRQQAGRSITTVSQLPKLPIIDTRKLTAAQHKLAAKIFERFKHKNFRAVNEAYICDARQELDHAVLVELLGLPKSILQPLELLRNKFCHEPSVHGGKTTRPQTAA